jgi:hypothetical protein
MHEQSDAVQLFYWTLSPINIETECVWKQVDAHLVGQA